MYTAQRLDQWPLTMKNKQGSKVCAFSHQGCLKNFRNQAAAQEKRFRLTESIVVKICETVKIS